MTLEQLKQLEMLVGDGVRLRKKFVVIETMRARFRELSQPVQSNVCKFAEIRMANGISELRFADTSNQSRNMSMELSADDGRKLVSLFIDFLEQQTEGVLDKLAAIPVGKDFE